jgi:hypothetical protein
MNALIKPGSFQPVSERHSAVCEPCSAAGHGEPGPYADQPSTGTAVNSEVRKAVRGKVIIMLVATGLVLLAGTALATGSKPFTLTAVPSAAPANGVNTPGKHSSARRAGAAESAPWDEGESAQPRWTYPVRHRLRWTYRVRHWHRWHPAVLHLRIAAGEATRTFSSPPALTLISCALTCVPFTTGTSRLPGMAGRR